MLQGRLFAYADAHRYRIGANYRSCRSTAARADVHNYNKDGAMRYNHPGRPPVYAPNSYGGPKADPQRYRDPSWFVEAAEIMRTAYEAHKDDNDFIQPGTLYRQVMTPTDRDHLVDNIVGHLSQGVERFIQERAVNDYWTQVDPDLGARVARAWAWRLCSEAGSSKDKPLAAPEQVPSSICATSTRTSATACPMTSTRLCRGRRLSDPWSLGH